MSDAERKVKKLLALAGITVNGSRPWDITVHNAGVYQRILADGSVGLGESYMDGWWDCKALDQFFFRVLRADLATKIEPNAKLLIAILKAKLFNLQRKSRAFVIGEKHYDIGNDLYTAMLDKRLTYTCGYWKNAKNLDEAQEAKLDLVCRKLGLKPGQKVLDIGCGWGSFAKYAAEKYKAKVVGITVSQEQVKLAKQLCKGLPVEIKLQDYRDVNEQFDHIVSLGMFEHVGEKNYRAYMEVAYRCLKDDGLFLLHTIGDSTGTRGNLWILKYIFPAGVIPWPKEIAEAVEGLFTIEDWHNFGADYDPTLMAWFRNFDKQWGTLKANYGERFYRMWKYYLLSCAGGFRARHNELWQIVLSKKGVMGGYQSVR